ncbi:MAG: IS1 family transposase [Bacteroidota bacterium]
MNVLPEQKKILVLNALIEGNSINSTVRMTGVNKRTILRLLVSCGEIAREIQDSYLVNLKARYIQVDEIWTFVAKKQKQVRTLDSGELGDQYVWVAMDSETKLVASYLIGKRSYNNAQSLMSDLKYRIPAKFQLSTDSFTAYFKAVDNVFGNDVNYGQVHKVYNDSTVTEKRYSPANIKEVIIRPLIGDPKKSRISTSHIERQNLTMRMQMRRFTRLTNAFSKKLKNLECAVSLHFFHYNFMRIHSTLRVTPAMEANITNRLWNWNELLNYNSFAQAI